MNALKPMNRTSPAKAARFFIPAHFASPFGAHLAAPFAALLAAQLLAPCAFAAPTAAALPTVIAAETAPLVQRAARDPEPERQQLATNVAKEPLPAARSSTHRWAPGLVVPLIAGAGLVTTIELDPEERIQSYASGFSSAWEFAAEGARLYLKPKRPRASTNLAVATATRTYLFELRSAPAPSAPKTNASKGSASKASSTKAGPAVAPVDYLVRVTLPRAPEAPGSRSISPEMKRETAARLLAKPLVPGAAESDISARYRMNFGDAPESRSIAPVAAGDDGRFTYLALPAGADFPAVFRKGAEGEAIVASHLEADGRLVIHGVYPELRLRAGAAVVGLYREPEAQTLAPLPGKAATPEISRELIHESEEHLKEEKSHE